MYLAKKYIKTLYRSYRYIVFVVIFAVKKFNDKNDLTIRTIKELGVDFFHRELLEVLTRNIKEILHNGSQGD